MDNFYREELMDIYRNPSHKGKLTKHSVKSYEKNPMCGDEVTIFLDVKDGIIKDAKFEGSACVVSIVSSEILLEEIIGKSIEEASKISKEDLLGYVDLNLTTSRVRCATLALTALKKSLAIYEKKYGAKN